ncbi:hypothetical protein [Candidatus Palauibacter sp.]|uniref:hypothetical protein n=1 Tax=Candidatus Palauibacter sp. TaxID=3101350 RepID=UPI003B5991E3
MIKTAVIRWYLYALYLRFLRLRDRWLRPRALSEVDANLAHTLFAEYEAVAGESDQLAYRDMLRNREFKVSSQNGEDGLLAFIFGEVGVTNRRFVEFGVGDGRECNCANLAIWFGWSGLMIEGDSVAAQRAREYYATLTRPDGDELCVRQAHVTAENINETIASAGLRGEIDLLSIDIDGNDYWLWEAIDIVDPRVVVIEYNGSFGLRSISVPYDPEFVRFRKHRSGWYHGASVGALAKLGERKGYALVGTDSRGVNVFFVRKNVLGGRLRALGAGDAYRPQSKRLVVGTVERQFQAIRHLDYVEI